MHKVIVWVVIKKDNKILLLKKPNNTELTFAGGYVEDNKSLKSAAIIRVKEEVNIDLQYEDLKFLCVIDREMDSGYKVHVFFEATNWQGELQNNEPHLHSEVQWYDLNNLPEEVGVLAAAAINSLNTENRYYFKDDFEIHNKH